MEDSLHNEPSVTVRVKGEINGGGPYFILSGHIISSSESILHRQMALTKQRAKEWNGYICI